MAAGRDPDVKLARPGGKSQTDIGRLSHNHGLKLARAAEMDEMVYKLFN